MAAGDQPDIDRVVQAARHAFNHSGWATMPANDRAVLLHRLADLIDQHAAVISEIESLDVGKPVGQAQAFDVPHAAKTFRYYADLSIQTRRRDPLAISGNDARSVRLPAGVCGFIFPWNSPFLLAGWGLAPALAAGTTVVVKPAEDTPLTTLHLARLVAAAGIPPGVVNVVTGRGETTGAALARHPGINRMSFTGSPEVGRLVAEACGRNLVPAKLELGGKGAAVLFDDIDVDQAAVALANAITLNAGQVCCTATRWLVHDKIRKPFVAKAVSTLKEMKIGCGSDEGTQLGPVVSEKQRNRVLGYIDKGKQEGAETLLAGGRESMYCHADVTRPDQVKAAIARIVRGFGTIDVLFNNAGTAIVGSVEKLSVDDWDRTFAINVKSMFLCSKFVVPIMRRNGGGAIIHMGSESGLVGLPMHPAYCASKGAVVNLTRSMAIGHAADRIRVNCLCPGTIPTPLYQEFVSVLPNRAEVESFLQKEHPLGLGTERDIAHAAVHLASDESRYMTGATLAVDGGYTAK